MKGVKERELWALEAVRQYYENEGYIVSDGGGADLTAVKGEERLILEVKGRSMVWDFITMTVNELEQFKTNPNYRLCEVIPDKDGSPIVEIRSPDEIAEEQPASIRVFFRRKKEEV